MILFIWILGLISSLCIIVGAFTNDAETRVTARNVFVGVLCANIIITLLYAIYCRTELFGMDTQMLITLLVIALIIITVYLASHTNTSRVNTKRIENFERIRNHYPRAKIDGNKVTISEVVILSLLNGHVFIEMHPFFEPNTIVSFSENPNDVDGKHMLVHITKLLDKEKGE